MDYFISYFSICVEQGKHQQICQYWEQIIDICVNKTSKQTFNQLFPKIKDFYLNLSENEFTKEVIIPYIIMLYKIIFLSCEIWDSTKLHIIEVISQLQTDIPENVSFISKEMLFVFYLTSYNQIDTKKCEFLTESVLTELLKLIGQEKFIESFEKLNLLSEFEISILPGKWAKLKCLFGTYQFQKLTELCHEELGVINKNQTPYWFQFWYKNELLLTLANTYLEMEDFIHCKRILLEIKGLDQKQELLLKYLKINILISERNFEEAITLFESVDYNNDVIRWICLQTDILSQNGLSEEAIELISKLTSENDSSFLCHFSLGMCYWRSGLVARENKDKCLKCFLKSFSLDQLNYKPMLFIGTYYNTVSTDQL